MAQTHHIASTPGQMAAALAALFALLVGACDAMVLQAQDRKGLLNVRKGFRFMDVAVDGNQEMFLANNRQLGASSLGVGGRFEQTLRVDVDMEVLPNLSVRGRFDDTLFPAKQELAVEYRGEDFQMTAGDVTAGFAGAEFPMESQTIFGVRSRYSFGAHSISGVAARLSGAAGHYEGKGDNTRGPYFLPDRRLLANSDRVFVDGVRRFRGTDYTLDHSTGVLTFTQAVDDRFRISVDYEYEAPVGTPSQNLLVSRYAGEVTTAASVGVSLGTRRGGTGAARDLFGMDARWSAESGTSVGGEVALAKQGEALGQALRGEAAGPLGAGTWSTAVRAVEPEYSGLSAVTSRRDIADATVSLSYPVRKDVRVSSRLLTARDNLGEDPGRPVVRDYIVESGAIWTLPRATRLELTLDNRNELHQDDREVHGLDASATAWRLGARYRLERHLLRSSYELRASSDRAGGGERHQDTHVLGSQVQSQLFGSVYSTATLQLARAVDADSGALSMQEVLTGMDVSASLLKHIGTSVSYTLQQRTGVSASDTHSAGITLRAQGFESLSAETSLQMKRTVVPPAPGTNREAIAGPHGDALGNAILSSRLGWQIGTRASVSADYQRPLAVTSARGPATFEVRGSVRPAKEYDLGAGYRIDEQRDGPAGTAYQARVGYLEATVSF